MLNLSFIARFFCKSGPRFTWKTAATMEAVAVSP